jgi:hypothetical protein
MMIRLMVMELGRFIQIAPHFLISGRVTPLLHRRLSSV